MIRHNAGHSTQGIAVSSNFDSKQLWFHGVRPSVHTVTYKVLFIILGGYIISMKLPCDNPWMV